MLSFRSEVFPDCFLEKITYQSKSMFIGSCFTEHIGKRLSLLRFPVLINPFGILYNPVSVANSIHRIIQKEPFLEKDLNYFNEKWISFMHHGRFSSIHSDEVLNAINTELNIASSFIDNSQVLFITYGTAWVYKHKKTNQVVANCHKIPASEFEHYLISVADIVEIYSNLLSDLNKRNRNLKIVFTVSPVRHWKDGPINNQLSKSVLIMAVHELIKNFDFVSYFPSYEIFMDDLRDYRFYADDLFHPNQLGIDYVWEKFRTCFIHPETLELSEKVDKITRAMAHRPFYPKTQAYLKFIKSNISSIEQLKLKFPEMNFEAEIEYFLSEKDKYFRTF